jgi:hypothetical protein
MQGISLPPKGQSASKEVTMFLLPTYFLHNCVKSKLEIKTLLVSHYTV